jgi:hypothetical protein
MTRSVPPKNKYTTSGRLSALLYYISRGTDASRYIIVGGRMSTLCRGCVYNIIIMRGGEMRHERDGARRR